eukprot:6355467-Amphidinium_carterae.1
MAGARCQCFDPCVPRLCTSRQKLSTHFYLDPCGEHQGYMILTDCQNYEKPPKKCNTQGLHIPMINSIGQAAT